MGRLPALVNECAELFHGVTSGLAGCAMVVYAAIHSSAERINAWHSGEQEPVTSNLWGASARLET